MENKGEIVAHDIRPKALAELKRRAARAGVTIIRILPRPRDLPDRDGEAANTETRTDFSAPALAGEAATPDLVPGSRRGFDLVLLDAPCSGSGTVWRQPELMRRLTTTRLDELKALQDALLRQAADATAAGGRLIYVTCSVWPDENEDRIDAFLMRRRDFAVMPASRAWPSRLGEVPREMDRYFKPTPRKLQTDGFFTAVLRRAR